MKAIFFLIILIGFSFFLQKYIVHRMIIKDLSNYIDILIKSPKSKEAKEIRDHYLKKD